jgi:mono/diheme cytochrome c family protein
MSKRVLVVAVLALLLVGSAVAFAHEDGDPERGATLYVENCLACHGPKGEARATHPAFAGVIQYDVTFADVLEQGVDGTYMHAWGVDYGGPLTHDDINDLLAYVQTWSLDEEVPLPPVEVPAGLDPAASLGAELYLTNCATCHGPQGQGRGANGPAFGPNADVLTLARRGEAAPGKPENGMPPFAQAYGGPLSENDLANIVAYVRTWQEPSALQEVAEDSPEGAGMLILLIGLGALLVVGGSVLLRRVPPAGK